MELQQLYQDLYQKYVYLDNYLSRMDLNKTALLRALPYKSSQQLAVDCR